MIQCSMAASNVCIISQQSLLPVTALEFCSVSGSLYLLAGEGPHLKMFSINGRFLTQVELLPFNKIHGIRPAPNHSSSAVGDDVSSGRNVLVFGQKSLRFVTLQPSLLRIECSSAIVSIEDWILDVCWLNRDGDAIPDTWKVAAVTAHNAVHIIEGCGCGFGREARVVAKYQCEVCCILYSARLEGSCVSGVAVVAGTVFNDILLWHLEGERPSSTRTTAVAGEERVIVRLALSGHEGVIFSTRFDANASRLVSVSDDRTVRVWDLPPGWKSMERSRQTSCSLILYGHTARVWDGRLLPDCVVSIGEDAMCRVWEYGGRCVHVVEGHRGKSIWSMAVDESSGLVATGGGDCSIRLFSLQTHREDNMWSLDATLPVSESALEDGASGAAEETPRSVELCGHTALCLSNTGSLYASELPALTTADEVPATVWQLVHQDSEFSGYGIMSLSPDHQWLALGSLQGHIALLLLEKNGLLATCCVKWCGHEGKVFSLTWLNSSCDYDYTLLSCGPNGAMVVWGVHGPAAREPTPEATVVVEPLVCMSLPHSKHRWVMTATLVHSPIISSLDSVGSTAVTSTTLSSYWLVCGDRKGSLHVYQTNLKPPSSQAKKYLQPIQSLRGIHGANGVTHITVQDGHVVSCGRDGHCRTFSMHPHRGLRELTKFKLVKGVDWIERQFYSDTDQLVLGFHTTEVVLYSVTQNRCIMSINCGGGHRSYGFTSLPELCQSKKAVMVYIKKSVISLRAVDLTAQLTTPVLQKGFVGREAVSLQIVHSDPVTGSAVVAVGSEDCSVCLLSLQPSLDARSLAMRTERFVQGHISSVRALSTSQSVREPLHQQLLFSGGARASLKVWKIHGRGGGPEVTLEAEFSIHQDRSKKKKRKQPKRPGAETLFPECRIMTLTSLPLSRIIDEDIGRHYVAAGCSDGIVRQYIYSEETHGFSSLGNLQFHNRCILTLNHIVLDSAPSSRHASALCLLSAATDGKVVAWRVSTELLVPDSTSGTVGIAGESREHGGELCNSPPPLAVCQAHQSGINDMAIQQVNERHYHISTVGDDNALALLNLTLPGDSLHTARLEVLCTEPNAHASSITGVSFLSPSQVVTTSIDQRITVWRVGLGKSTVDDTAAESGVGSSQCGQPVRVEQVYSHTHDVADVSSLCLYQWGQNRAVVVMCGIGARCFVIQNQTL